VQARVELLKATMSPKTATNVILLSSEDSGKEEAKDTRPDVDPREVGRDR
jgi:hypothetical protein